MLSSLQSSYSGLCFLSEIHIGLCILLKSIRILLIWFFKIVNFIQFASFILFLRIFVIYGGYFMELVFNILIYNYNYLNFLSIEL